MSFYTDLATSAGRLIKAKGQALVLRSASAGAYDHAAGSAGVVFSEASVFGVVLAIPASEARGTEVLSTDKKVLLSVEGVVLPPQPKDALLIQGVPHEILTAKVLDPSGGAVLYTLQVRQGG